MSSFILHNAGTLLKCHNTRIPYLSIYKHPPHCISSISSYSSFSTISSSISSINSIASSNTNYEYSSTRTIIPSSSRGTRRYNKSQKSHFKLFSSTMNMASSFHNDNDNDDDLNDAELSSPSPSAPSYNSNNNKHKVIEVDIHSYLTEIEKELQTISTSIPNQTFQVKIRSQNRRPMIRTLLGITSKEEFYHLCRITRADLEYKKMYDFIVIFQKEICSNGYICVSGGGEGDDSGKGIGTGTSTSYQQNQKFMDEHLPSFQYAFEEIKASVESQYGSTSTSTSNSTTSILKSGEYTSFSSKTKKGVPSFSRLASGRKYKGNIMNMVKDLTPHLIQQCDEAMMPLSESRVLLEVIDLVAARHKDAVHDKGEGGDDDDDDNDGNNNANSNTSSFIPTEEYIQAAKQCVIDSNDIQTNQDEYNTTNSTSNTSNNSSNSTNSSNNSTSGMSDNLKYNQDSTLNGLKCEQACVSYLEEQYYNTSNDNNNMSTTTTKITSNSASTIATIATVETDHKKHILQNVVVNHKSTQSRSKYSNGNMKKKKGGWRKNTNRSINNDDDNHQGGLEEVHTSSSQSSSNTGIIWTSHGKRLNVCSEFDALVLHQSSSDANCQLTEFWEAKYSVSPSSLHDAITKKLSAVRSLLEDEDVKISYDGNHYTVNENTEYGLTKFGLFGMELLSPSHAIGQLRSTAASFALTNFVDVTLKSAKTGYVDVKVDYLRQQLHGLKKALTQSEDFEIVVRIVDCEMKK